MTTIGKAVLCLALAGAVPAQADVLEMRNGDRLSGEIVGLEKGKILFSGPYAKRVPLSWAEVASVHLDEPILIELASGEVVRGRIAPAEDGTVRLLSEDGERLVPLDALVALRRKPKPAYELSGGLNFGASVTGGNTSTESYHFDGQLGLRTRAARYGLAASADYEEDEDEATVNELELNADYARFLSKRWYVSSNLGLAHDPFQDLRLRTTIGIGAGYQLAETETRKLSAEAGLSYVWEDYEDGPDQEQPAARWALNYEEKFGERFTLFHRHELFVGLEDSDDSLFTSSTGLRVPLGESLRGTVQVDADYDGEPAPGAEHLDTALLVLLGYSL